MTALMTQFCRIRVFGAPWVRNDPTVVMGEANEIEPPIIKSDAVAFKHERREA